MAFARDLRVLLPFLGSPAPDRKAVAEILMYGFPLGTRTLFEGVACLDPGQAVEHDPSRGESRLFATEPLDFELRDPFENRAVSIAYLADAYRESVQRRVRTLRDRGFALVGDLSGGFDTRVVLAGLARETHEVTYGTFGYVRDESAVAQALFEAFDRPGRYVKLPVAAGYDYRSVEELLFRTDGLVNYYTMLVCHADVQAMKSTAPARAARFNGLGGEFIRHPYRNLAAGFSAGADAMLYAAAPAREIGAALGLSGSECRGIVKDDLDAYPETTRHTRLRRLYYLYYDRYVGHAGGERERGTFWGVSPLWAPRFARTVFSRVPLTWVGFPYFTAFMKALDPRLLSVPLFASATDLTSPSGVRRHHRRYYLTHHNSIVKSAPAVALARVLRGTKAPAGDELMSDYADRCARLASDLPREYQILDIPRTVAWPLPLRRRVVTLLSYWTAVRRRAPR